LDYRNSPNDSLPLDLSNLERETPFARQIESEEQDSLAHIFALKQDEPAPKNDPKPADLVPKTYHQYLKVFSKKESERMPIRKPWDHAIDLKETFKPKRANSYRFHPRNRKKCLISLTINYPRNISDLLNRNKPHQYSLYQRKMAESEWYRTIVT
jgi:hypothetical protein